jgi:hypothetical protein
MGLIGSVGRLSLHDPRFASRCGRRFTTRCNKRPFSATQQSEQIATDRFSSYGYAEDFMGDGMTNTPFDVFMYFLVFGGVPFLLVVVPLLLVPLFYRIAKRSLRGHSDKLTVAKPPHGDG